MGGKHGSTFFPHRNILRIQTSFFTARQRYQRQRCTALHRAARAAPPPRLGLLCVALLISLLGKYWYLGLEIIEIMDIPPHMECEKKGGSINAGTPKSSIWDWDLPL